MYKWREKREGMKIPVQAVDYLLWDGKSIGNEGTHRQMYVMNSRINSALWVKDETVDVLFAS